jgi:trk system potassium uptake protein TrkH
LDFKPVFFIIGILISILALSMVIPMCADLYFGNEDWKIFFMCIIVTSFFGGSLILNNNSKIIKIGTRQAFMMISLSWFMLSIFAALPFSLSDMNMSFTDSFFEAVSGLTTTGSTVITGLEDSPPGILLWRGILQWLGGIGIILMAMSVLPFLNIGGMQIFRTELSENEKVLPRTAQLAGSIGLIYAIFTVICIICYMLSGMQTFDAIAHALSTISTGGFSTYDSSFTHYNDTIWPEMVCILFMIVGALPFVLYLKAVRGNLRPLFTDTQVRWFMIVITTTILTLSTYLVANYQYDFLDALRRSAFNVISIITGSGFANDDFNAWGTFAICIFFFLMLIGGCAGSTTCSIKIFRYQVLFAVTAVQVKKLLYPHGVFIPHYNGKPIPADVPMSVMAFFFIYMLTCAVVAIALAFVGLDYIEAMSGAVTAVSNVGPGLGSIGPDGNFQHLPDSAKWILSFAMLIGRLEIFTVLVFLMPQFWRK